VREVRQRRHALPIPPVGNRQRAEPLPACQLIKDEIHGAVLTFARGDESRSAAQPFIAARFSHA
jgi:hypothetical protein